MSYFSEVYGDPELSAKARLVLVYLHGSCQDFFAL